MLASVRLVLGGGSESQSESVRSKPTPLTAASQHVASGNHDNGITQRQDAFTPHGDNALCGQHTRCPGDTSLDRKILIITYYSQFP